MDAQMEIMRVEGVNEPWQLKRDPVFSRLSGIHEEALELFDSMAQFG